MNNRQLIEALNREHRLEQPQWEQLFASYTPEDLDFTADMARGITVRRFGKKIYFRGIVEFSNICKNDCLYCGIRCSNRKVARYRLEPEEIIDLIKNSGGTPVLAHPKLVHDDELVETLQRLMK